MTRLTELLDMSGWLEVARELERELKREAPSMRIETHGKGFDGHMVRVSFTIVEPMVNFHVLGNYYGNMIDVIIGYRTSYYCINTPQERERCVQAILQGYCEHLARRL